MYRDFLGNSIVNGAHAIFSGDSENYFAICITPAYKNINICWWEGNVSSTVKKKQTQTLQSSSSEAKLLWKLVYFQPSISLICKV